MDNKELLYAELFFSEPQTVEDAVKATSIKNKFIRREYFPGEEPESCYELYNPYPYSINLIVNNVTFAFMPESITTYAACDSKLGMRVIGIDLP